MFLRTESKEKGRRDSQDPVERAHPPYPGPETVHVAGCGLPTILHSAAGRLANPQVTIPLSPISHFWSLGSWTPYPSSSGRARIDGHKSPRIFLGVPGWTTTKLASSPASSLPGVCLSNFGFLIYIPWPFAFQPQIRSTVSQHITTRVTLVSYNK